MVQANKKLSSIQVPKDFQTFANKHLNKQLQKAIKEDLKKRGIGVMGSPDLRSGEQRAKHKKKMAKKVIKKNPKIVKRLQSYKKD